MKKNQRKKLMYNLTKIMIVVLFLFNEILSFFTKYTLSFFGYGIYSMEYVIFMSNKECIMDFHWKKLLFHKLYFCNVDCPFYFNFKTDEVLKSFEEIDFLAFAL